MRRRPLLAAVLAGVTTGCVGELAPSGPRNPPEPVGSDDGGTPAGDDPDGLLVADWDVRGGDDGNLVVDAVVANTASEEQSGTLVVIVRVDDEETDASEGVTVAGDGDVSVSLAVDVAFDRFESEGSLSMRLEA